MLAALSDLPQALLSTTLSLSLELLLLALVQLLLLSLCLLPLKSRDTLVLLIDLQAVQVLVNLRIFELKVNTDLNKFLFFECSWNKVLYIFLYGRDVLNLVRSKIFLVVFRGLMLLFFIRLELSFCLRLLVSSVPITTIIVIATRTASIVASVSTLVVAATATTMATSAESSLFVLPAIFAGSVDRVEIVVTLGNAALSHLLLLLLGLVVASLIVLTVVSTTTATAFLVVRPLLAGGCLYLLVMRGICALSCTCRHLNLRL